MAETKRYYWIKLKKDFWNDKFIRKLRRMEHGDSRVIIYIKILQEVADKDGIFHFDWVEDSSYEELSLVIDEDTDLTREVMNFMLEHRLMVTCDGGLMIPDIDNYVGSEGASAERNRELRRRKASQSDATVTQARRDRDTEIEIEKEQEIYIDPEIENCVGEEKSDLASVSSQLPTIDEIRSYCVGQGLNVDADFFHQWITTAEVSSESQPFDWKEKLESWSNAGFFSEG